MHWRGPLLLPLLTLVPAGSPARAEQLTPSQYVAAVLSVSPEAKGARESLHAASSRWKSQAVARFFPALSFTGTLSPAKFAANNRFSFNTWQGAANDVGLTPGLSWNLFNSFTDQLNLKAAQLDWDAAQEDLESILQARAIEAVRAYFNLVLQQKLLEVANANRAAQKSQYELTQDRYKHGMKSLSDLLKTETDFHSSDLEVESTDAELRLALFKFNTLLDRDESTPVEFDIQLHLGTKEPPVLSEGLEAAMRDRPELKRDRANRSRADITYKLALQKVLPTLSLDFDLVHPLAADFRTDSGAFGLGTADYGLALKLSLPSSFNFYSQTKDLAAARSVRKTSIHASESLRRRVREEVYRAHIELLRALRSYEIALRKEDISRQNFELVSEQYSQGSADVIRLSQALLDYVSAQRERQRAFNESNISRTEYRQAIGEPIWH